MSSYDDHRGNAARALREAPAPVPDALPSDDGRDPFDSFEVPAAILCAVCGHADCEGCISDDEGESGVIAIIPWERPGGAWQRLWATANSTTTGAEAFFGALPRGAVEPALTFALLAEGIAISSLVLVATAVLFAIFPDLMMQVLLDNELAADAGRWVAIGIPAVTVWMVAVHAIHGFAVDHAARRFGTAQLRKRALRFGLYACGWDLMTSPLGIVYTLVTRGVGAAAELFGLALTVPAKATTALARGAYRLDDERARRVHRRAVAVAMVVTVVSVVGVLFALAL